jgi:hypothetical protein
MRLLAMHAFVHQYMPEDSKRVVPRGAPDGSQEAVDRINAAALKRLARQRKAVKHHG